MVFREKSIQMVKPYIEELAKTHNGYVSENSLIAFGRVYDALSDEYDLVLRVEDDFELGIRFSGDENKAGFLAIAYFIFSVDGKSYKVLKPISSDILNEDNIKSMIQKFNEIYQEERKK